MKAFLFFVSGVVLVGCGESTNQNRALDQAALMSANDVQYQLTDLELKAQFEYQNGLVKNSHEQWRSEKAIPSEKIGRRVGEDGNYELMINSQRVPIRVFGNGRIDAKEPIKKEEGQCRREGFEQANGRAEFEKFEFYYRLDLELKGAKCFEEFLAEFEKLQRQSLGSLNLNTVAQLQEADAWDHENVQRLRVEIRMTGDGG